MLCQRETHGRIVGISGEPVSRRGRCIGVPESPLCLEQAQHPGSTGATVDSALERGLSLIHSALSHTNIAQEHLGFRYGRVLVRDGLGSRRRFVDASGSQCDPCFRDTRRQRIRVGVECAIKRSISLLEGGRFYIVVRHIKPANGRYVTCIAAALQPWAGTLNFLGRVSQLPLIDAALLDPEEAYDIRVRTVLSTEDFPGPLRLLTFWRRDWTLRSDWYEWPLED